jgi:hypothetical protein
MREGCKRSGASEAWGSGAEERWRGGDDEADSWGPCGSDRGRRRHRRAVQTRRRDGFWQIRQGRVGRDGLSAGARPTEEKGGGWWCWLG